MLTLGMLKIFYFTVFFFKSVVQDLFLANLEHLMSPDHV